MRSLRLAPYLIAIVCAVTGLVLGWQGWRSRVPTFDLLTHYGDARLLVEEGQIPVKGTPSSFGAYNPPGVTWLLAPGLLFTREPRLFEVAGTVALFVGTLVGIFLIARHAFGPWVACVAVGLYSLSPVGAFYATSLWPRGQPFFFVWMVWATYRWALERRPAALGAALLMWGIGMYVFMEIAPAIVLLPIVWYLYRPPVRVMPVAAAIVLTLVVWLPYLSFQRTRNFVDLWSLLLRQPLFARGLPDNYRDLWCQPAIPLRAGVGAPAAPAQPAPSLSVSRRAVAAIVETLEDGSAIVRDSASNFETALPRLHLNLVLMLLTVAGLGALGLSESAAPAFAPALWQRIRPARLRIPVSLLVLVGAVLAPVLLTWLISPDGLLEPRSLIALRLLRFWMMAGAIVLLLLPLLSEGLRWLAARFTAVTASREERVFLTLSVAAPWALLVLLTAPGRSDRHWWLWALQTVPLAALLCGGGLRLRRWPAVRLLIPTAVAILVALSPFHIQQLRAWQRDGWSGRDASQAAVAAFIAAERRGGPSPHVGYNVYFATFQAAMSGLDRRLRVGAEIDLLLEYRGVSNGTQCPEGLSANDDYRVVEVSVPQNATYSNQIDAPMDDFVLRGKFDTLHLFQRETSYSPER